MFTPRRHLTVVLVTTAACLAAGAPARATTTSTLAAHGASAAIATGEGSATDGAPSAADPSAPPERGRGARAAASRAPSALVPGLLDVEAENERLTEQPDWLAGSLQQQLDRDPTLVPFGKGAVFVPTMSSGFDEPQVTVWLGEQLAAEGKTGQRIVLSPGTYEVRFGSGSGESDRVSVQATVRERHTMIVPVSWAGLQVHVIDEQATAVRASYEIIRVDDRQYVGIGFGTDELAGEPLSTWILRPGLYKIVRVGETYRARRDFSTVRIEPGRLTHFLLVVDPETGDFVGGGEVPETELFRPRDGFFGSVVLGGDVSFSARTNSIGAPDGVSFNVRGFVDGRLSFDLGGAPLLLQLQLEEQQTKTPNLPFQNSNDRLKLDALYVYPLQPWIGPYVRAGAETNLFDVNQQFEQAEAIRLTRLDGTVQLLSSDTVKLRPPLGLTRIKEGVGLHLRLFKSLIGESSLRTGVGARHSITRDLYALASSDEGARGDPTPGSYDYVAIEGTNQIGIEASATMALRISRYVVINLDVDGLLPFDDPSALIADVEGSISLKLTSYASLNYVVRLRQDPALAPDPSIEQDVRLRFSLELL